MPHNYDLLCLSHLRWNHVYQRPQHLMTRCARDRRVFFVEEPIYDSASPRLDVSHHADGVWIVVPHLPEGTTATDAELAQAQFLTDLMSAYDISRYVIWYYTPMAIGFSRHLAPDAIVYDCMDELSAFHGAASDMKVREQELLARADVMFTGGQSLYEAKRAHHSNVHALPSSVDVAHFASGKSGGPGPRDQAEIPHPRLGYMGVLDERIDLHLLARVAELRPQWQLILIGPTAKIDPSTLPRGKNLHYLGGKPYAALPSYLAGWDVGLMPFAINDATRYISPTKTPEYLAAGLPVVSTPIRDVITPYGERGLVRIASTATEFVDACEAALEEDPAVRRESVGEFLRDLSWDRTWDHMARLIDQAISERSASELSPVGSYA